MTKTVELETTGVVFQEDLEDALELKADISEVNNLIAPLATKVEVGTRVVNGGFF